MSTSKQTTPVQLTPFQQQDVASNQQNIPLQYLGGERLMSLHWISDALDEVTQQVQGSGKKG